MLLISRCSSSEGTQEDAVLRQYLKLSLLCVDQSESPHDAVLLKTEKIHTEAHRNIHTDNLHITGLYALFASKVEKLSIKSLVLK
jgi:hypothetical protein